MSLIPLHACRSSERDPGSEGGSLAMASFESDDVEPGSSQGELIGHVMIAFLSSDMLILY